MNNNDRIGEDIIDNNNNNNNDINDNNDNNDNMNDNDDITVSDHEEYHDDFDFNYVDSTGNLVDNIPIVSEDVLSNNIEHIVEESVDQELESKQEETAIQTDVAPSEPTRYNLRPTRAKKGKYEKKREYGLHLTVKQAIDKLGDESIKAISKEMKQLIDLEAFHGVHFQDIPREQRKKIIPSSMFLKEKYKADGTFEKLKARLVAGGHRQDKTVYEGKTSSPTVSTSSVFIIAAIAAMEGKAVATVDVPGAYLRAEMPKDGEKVYMRLDKFISNILISIDNNYKQYLNDNNTMIVQLDKALYGCIQSALLWYNELKGILNNLGYIANPYDTCVFNRIEDNNTQTTITIHVDDLFITAGDEKILDRVINELNNIFKDFSVNRRNKHNYLGMVFNFNKTNKSVNVEMNNYINEIITYYNIDGVATTPASKDLFTTKSSSRPLTQEEKKLFHSMLAKVMYLAKRVRPECLVVCSFLATRVNNATEDDMSKLIRLLKYLNGSKELGLTLTADNYLIIIEFIDEINIII